MDAAVYTTRSPTESGQPIPTRSGSFEPQALEKTNKADTSKFREKLLKLSITSVKRLNAARGLHPSILDIVLGHPRKYVYSSLGNTNRIRLFYLHPGSGHEPISGSIKETLVDDLSETVYEAISYVLGDPSDTVNIHAQFLGDFRRQGVIPITRNLNDALRRVRCLDAIRPIWADGICINQKDISERGHQVKKMRDIYEKANRALIWLGPDPQQESKSAFELVGELLMQDREWRCHEWIFQHSDHSGWACLDGILQRAWFTRIWILQEIGVAASAIFFCGDNSIGKDELFKCCRILESYKHLGESLPLDTSIKWVTRLDTHFQFKQSARMTRFELFDMARLSRASDPSDMVYALFGHPVFGEDSEGDFIDVDYFLTRENVYFSVASQLLLEASSPLQLLSLVKHTNQNFQMEKTLMSWIPEWDIQSDVATLGLRPTDFKACGSTRPDFTATAEGLYIQGCSMDRVIWQSDILTSEDFTFNEHAKYPIAETLRRLSAIGRDGVSGEFCMKASSTLTANKRQTYCSDLHRYLDSDQAATEHIPQAFRAGNLMVPLDKFNRIAREKSTGRRLFATENGCLGLGPRTMRTGDEICVLFGAPVPFIVRLAGLRGRFRTYWLCGECFVFGIMDGEVDSMLAEGKVQQQKFRLI